MKDHIKRILVLFFLMCLTWNVKGQNTLPECQGNDPSKWTACIGINELKGVFRYVGEYKEGKKTGQGTLSNSDGSQYIGNFKDEKFNGQGTYTYPNGNIHLGEFKDDEKNGKGTFTLANGDKIIAEWKNGKILGTAVFLSSSTTTVNRDKYYGEFNGNDGKYNGRGVLIKADGKRLEGIWSDNKLIREEKIDISSFYVEKDNKTSNNSDTCPSIDKSKNNFSEQVKNWNNCIGDYDYGTAVMTSSYKNGIPNGQAILKYKNGQTLKFVWQNGLMELSNVEIIYLNGEKYIGNVNGDLLPHGVGTKTDATGKILYSGFFHNGLVVDQNSAESKFLDSIIRNQMIGGNSSDQCIAARNNCKNSNNYYQCMQNFNTNQPCEGLNCWKTLKCDP